MATCFSRPESYELDLWPWQTSKMETSGDWTVVNSKHVFLIFCYFLKQNQTSCKTNWKYTSEFKVLAYVCIPSYHYHKILQFLMKTDDQIIEYSKSKRKMKKCPHWLDGLVLVLIKIWFFAFKPCVVFHFHFNKSAPCTKPWFSATNRNTCGLVVLLWRNVGFLK